MLLCDVRRGSRKAQVLGSPRMPNARWDHLSLRQGVEIMPTGMAPPREEGAGWARPSQILRSNYGFTLSSGYATYLTHPTTAQCQKLLDFSRRGVSHDIGISPMGGGRRRSVLWRLRETRIAKGNR